MSDVEEAGERVAYLILADCAPRDGRDCRRSRWCRIYFARRGYLWTMPAKPIFTHPAYLEDERGLLHFAKQITRQKG